MIKLSWDEEEKGFIIIRPAEHVGSNVVRASDSLVLTVEEARKLHDLLEKGLAPLPPQGDIE